MGAAPSSPRPRWPCWRSAPATRSRSARSTPDIWAPAVPADDAQRYVRANRELWNAITPYHVASRFYDVEGLKAGHARQRAGMDALEIALVGDVRGKTLLHLQ